MLKAGFAATCITPPPGKEIPGLFEQRIARGVLDDLYARAAVVDDGRKCVALVQTDAIALPEEIVAASRKEAQRLCGVRGKDCLIAATHTHSGGPVFGGFLSQADPAYGAFLIQQIAAAISEAYRKRRPALVGVDASKATGVAFNRRFHMKDGSQRTHPGKMNPGIIEPTGPEDPTVTVVGFLDPKTSRPIGCLVNFACHATHINGHLFSADYPKWIVDTLQAVYGSECGIVFLNGACGDVTQVDNRSARPAEFGPYWCERTGRVVAGGAIQALARIDYTPKASIDAQSVTVNAKIRTPESAALKAARDLLAKHPVTAQNVETIYANELLKVEAIRRKTPTRQLEIMGIRIADALFWGVPAEFFQAFALAVRAASPFPHTCCVELANGYNGYVCAPSSFKGGGYEVRTARSSLLTEDTGGRIVDAAKRLCRAMYKRAEKEIRALPRQRIWPGGDESALDGIKQLRKKR